MNQSPFQIKAALVDDDTSIPIDVQYTSKYSLLIRCLDDENFENGKEFSNLVLRKNGNSYDLGRCRYLSEPGVNDYMGRLVCINEIYDLENLLVNDKLVRLENPSLKLPLLLPLKHKICNSFKSFTANLTYDLSLYKDLFDSLDEEYCEEPEPIRAAIQENIS